MSADERSRLRANQRVLTGGSRGSRAPPLPLLPPLPPVADPQRSLFSRCATLPWEAQKARHILSLERSFTLIVADPGTQNPRRAAVGLPEELARAVLATSTGSG